jgi:hypothetical protein
MTLQAIAAAAEPRPEFTDDDEMEMELRRLWSIMTKDQKRFVLDNWDVLQAGEVRS